MRYVGRTACGMAVLTCVIAFVPACDFQSLPSVIPSEPDSLIHHISVARHEDVFLSTGQVNTIFETCTGLLNSVEGPCPDVACPSILELDGRISTFDHTGSVVTTEDEMDDLFEHPADIKVVSLMVGVCGVSDPDDTTVVLGCAYTNGSAILTANAPPDVWAHEWGHVQGLPHRNDCESNLMHAFEVQTNAVNTTERNAFLSASRASRASRAISPGEDNPEEFVATLRPIPGQATEAWLDDLVDRNYLRGVPAGVLGDRSDPAVTAALVELLQTELDPVRQRNTLRLLGLQRDPAGVVPITVFLASRAGDLGPDEVGVVAEAQMALGRLTAVDESGTAVRWLIDGAEPQSWRDLGYTWNGGDAGPVLARLAVMALGLSEAPEAADWLEQLRTAATSVRAVDGQLLRQIDEALTRVRGDAAESGRNWRGAMP